MSNENINTIQTKSEILFLYESTFSIPNGDPFTGEQRYDEETKRILISDVRIKRFIRDYLFNEREEIYVISNPEALAEVKGTDAARRFKMLQEKYKNQDPKAVLLKCIDARLFGGIVTIKKTKKGSEEESDSAAFNITGPVQFALLNPSLNEVDLRMHQNTSVFASDEKKEQGAIGTTTVVPYSVNQIHGWINPFSAKETCLTEDDVVMMFKALWRSINNANTRTKSNQSSLLLLQIIYTDPAQKLYGVDRLINLKMGNKKGEQLRSIDDFEFDFSALLEAVNNDKVSSVKYYTETKIIENKLESNPKFKKMTFK